MRFVTRAPAKLNLCLYVGPRRPDGLHELRSVFQPITLADEVVLEHAASGVDEVVCPGVEGPNLAAAALHAFRERFSWDAEPVRVERAALVQPAARDALRRPRTPQERRPGRPRRMQGGRWTNGARRRIERKRGVDRVDDFLPSDLRA